MTTDRILAEKVMGWKYHPTAWTNVSPWYWVPGGKVTVWAHEWRPSENPAQLDECFRKVGHPIQYAAVMFWSVKHPRVNEEPGMDDAQWVIEWQLASTKEKADALAEAVGGEG